MQTIRIHPQRLFALQDYAIVVLNRDIRFSKEFFVNVWNKASIRHLVDGGINHFYNFLDNLPDHQKDKVKLAEIASGDFDSATKESLNRIKKSNCKVVLTEDQNETDFTKALRVLRDHLNSLPKELAAQTKNIICICEFSGRLDHVFANLNTLHKNVFLEDAISSTSQDEGITKRNVILLSGDTVSWLLPANHKNQIVFEEEVPNVTCGVLPLMGPTTFTSSGLKWDLTPDLVCSFGGLISSSNLAVSKVVEIIPHDNHSILSFELNEQNYVI